MLGRGQVMKVQFLRPSITAQDIRAVVRVLRSGWLLLRDETIAFEKRFAQYFGAADAVLTHSCTSSIQIALAMAGVGAGDEVITTPLSYVATANPIVHLGATPVFVDVDPRTGLIEPGAIERAITRKTRAIVPVHLYGQMADMKMISKIARRRGIRVIEDAAHAIESRRDGVQPGQLSFAACFSFHTSKNITAGQAGAIIFSAPELAEQAKLLRRDGVQNVGVKRRMVALGYKAIATEFTAALLSSQLKRIDAQWKKRKQLYERYAAALRELGVAFNQVLPRSRHAYHMIVMWVEPKRRDEIIARLAAAGVDTSIHYEAIPLEPFYRQRFGYKAGGFPVAERLGASTITLPMHPLMTAREQGYVIEQLRTILPGQSFTHTAGSNGRMPAAKKMRRARPRVGAED